uniref:Uncharacterized protein n=1 Tax=Ananas comosus var. bracteatus TaxID=296719 RepID=A0A6V7P1Z0_ANACO|nr:unnamed protein product [Ananas comosus var. bracteatus]
MDLVSNGVIQNRVFGCGWISSSNSFLNNGSSYRPGSVSLVRYDGGDDDNVEEEEEEEEEGGIEEEFIEDFDDEIIMDDTEDFEDDFESDDANLYVGDGGEGGGISLAGTWWDKEALAIAEDCIEKLSSKYGSPSMNDIEAFSSAYQSRLDEAELGKRIPENISLEVSSPGVERVVRVPEELERFKDGRCTSNIRLQMQRHLRFKKMMVCSNLSLMIWSCANAFGCSRCEDKQKASRKRQATEQETARVAAADAVRGSATCSTVF